MNSVYRLKAELQCDMPVEQEMLKQIRGYMGRKFIDNDLIHNHSKDGLHYRYPLVQYKSIRSNLVLLGINEGGKALYETMNSLDFIDINGKTLRIQSKNIEISSCNIHITDNFRIYKFITPYFSFNQENYGKYKNAGSEKEKKELIDRILTGNILSFLKSMNIWLEEKLFVDFFLTSAKIVPFKELKVSGLMGEFATNIQLPDFIGLGKSTALGHGVIISNRRTYYGNNERRNVSGRLTP